RTPDTPKRPKSDASLAAKTGLTPSISRIAAGKRPRPRYPIRGGTVPTEIITYVLVEGVGPLDLTFYETNPGEPLSAVWTRFTRAIKSDLPNIPGGSDLNDPQ